MVCSGSQVQGLSLPPSLLWLGPTVAQAGLEAAGVGLLASVRGCSCITCILSSSLGFLLCHGDVCLIGWFLE